MSKKKLEIGNKIVFHEIVDRKGYVMNIDKIGIVKIRLFDDDSQKWVSRREITIDKVKE